MLSAAVDCDSPASMVLARRRRAVVCARERHRHPGAANQRLAGAVRHHPRCRSARGHACRRRRHRGVAVTARPLPAWIRSREAFGYHALIQILLMGVSGAFLTGDLFNLYVWFEVMLVASFVLMALHRTSAQFEAAFKYVTINLIASSIFLTALGLLYGVTGTLNMADLARVWPPSARPASTWSWRCCSWSRSASRLGCFRCSSGCRPRITRPPAAVGAVFAGLLTKVGVYALMRIFTLLFQGAPPALPRAAAGDVGGDDGRSACRGARAKRDFRRILSFNLVGHIGYTTASAQPC